MLDLFGNEHPEQAPPLKAAQLSLIDAAAERNALQSGRPLSQERTEIMAPNPAAFLHRTGRTAWRRIENPASNCDSCERLPEWELVRADCGCCSGSRRCSQCKATQLRQQREAFGVA